MGDEVVLSLIKNLETNLSGSVKNLETNQNNLQLQIVENNKTLNTHFEIITNIEDDIKLIFNSQPRPRISIAFGFGGRGDKSFNDSADLATKLLIRRPMNGIVITDFPTGNFNTDEEMNNKYVIVLEKLLANDPDIIFGVGYTYLNALKYISDLNKDNIFVVIDTLATESIYKNLKGINFRIEEATYLTGIAALQKTKEINPLQKNVGFLLPFKDFEQGEPFAAGTKQALSDSNDNFNLVIEYINDNPKTPSDYMKTFDNPDKAEEIANKSYKDGTIVIAHATANSGLGILLAAKKVSEETGIKRYMIGVDSDLYNLVSDELRPYVLTSSLKNIGYSIFEFTVNYLNFNLPASNNSFFGLKENGVGFSTSGNHNSPATIEKMIEAKNKIISGDIVVNSTL